MRGWWNWHLIPSVDDVIGGPADHDEVDGADVAKDFRVQKGFTWVPVETVKVVAYTIWYTKK